MLATVSMGIVAHASNVADDCSPAFETQVGDPGLNSPVWSCAATNINSSVGPALYVGGQFSEAGGVAAKNIARWDGASWSPLGGGAVNGGTVYALVIDDAGGVLYAGGNFANMNALPGTRNIAKWTGLAWSDVGGGMGIGNAGIRALAIYNGELYAGGFLNDIGGVTAHKIARFDGTNWHALPGDPLGTTDVVYALCVHDDGDGAALYIGGEFTDAAGNANADNILRFDGKTISPVGRGVNDDVEALASFDGELYVAGQFVQATHLDGTAITAHKIARWNSTTWSTLGSGVEFNAALSNHVWSLASFDDGGGSALYAGGNFFTPGDQLARWDGVAWSSPGEVDLNGAVKAMATFDDGAIREVGGESLFITGLFTTVNGATANRIAQWRGCEDSGSSCPADIVPKGGDDQVSIADVSAVIAAYGLPCDECAQDIAPQPDGDNAVTIADINAVLSAFGPCD